MEKQDTGNDYYFAGLALVVMVFFIGMCTVIIRDMEQSMRPPSVTIFEPKLGDNYFYCDEVAYPYDPYQLQNILGVHKQVITEKIASYNSHNRKLFSVPGPIVPTVSQSKQTIARFQNESLKNTLQLVPSVKTHHDIIRLVDAYNKSVADYNKKLGTFGYVATVTLDSDSNDTLLSLK